MQEAGASKEHAGAGMQYAGVRGAGGRILEAVCSMQHAVYRICSVL